jgi:Fe-S-cluster containining protein
METGEMLSGDLKLDVGGEHYELNLTIPATPVKPQRMLPVFQRLTNEIVARGIERATEGGKAISCKAACGACCRQPLLISEAEAFNLADLVDSMPAERRSTIQLRFREGREHFEKIGWFDRFDALRDLIKEGESDETAREFVSLVTDYMEQRVACPFLEAESCSIYEDRPLICREYLVTSPAENCANPRPDNTEKIPISGRPSKAFSALTKTDNSEKPSSLLLIRLLEFADTNTEKFEERIGPAWADDFFRLLTNRKDPGLPEKVPEPPAAAGG